MNLIERVLSITRERVDLPGWLRIEIEGIFEDFRPTRYPYTHPHEERLLESIAHVLLALLSPDAPTGAEPGREQVAGISPGYIRPSFQGFSKDPAESTPSGRAR